MIAPASGIYNFNKGPTVSDIKQIESIHWNKILNPKVNLLLVPYTINPLLKDYIDLLISENKSYYSWAEVIKIPENQTKHLFIQTLFCSFLKFDKITTGRRTNPIDLHLEVVQTSSGELFHQDYVDLRMLQTLSGPTIQYLDNDNVNREHILGEFHDPITKNRMLVKDPKRVRSVPDGWISIMKGVNNPEDTLSCIHKSAPEIDSTRLVFTMKV
jgi:hypothetical protein